MKKILSSLTRSCAVKHNFALNKLIHVYKSEAKVLIRKFWQKKSDQTVSCYWPFVLFWKSERQKESYIIWNTFPFINPSENTLTKSFFSLSLWSDVLFSVEEVGVGKWESTAYLYPFYPPSTANLARAGPERRLGYTRVLTWFGIHIFLVMTSSCVHPSTVLDAVIQLSLLWTTYESWKGIMKLK